MTGLHVDRVQGVAVARLPEDIDAANSLRLREELVALVGNEAFDLVLDLSRTRYLDSAGIDMLFRVAQRLVERRATLRLVIGPRSLLLRLAEIVGLGRAMAIHESVEDAVAHAVAGAEDRGQDRRGTEPSPRPTGDAGSEGCRSVR